MAPRPKMAFPVAFLRVAKSDGVLFGSVWLSTESEKSNQTLAELTGQLGGHFYGSMVSVWFKSVARARVGMQMDA